MATDMLQYLDPDGLDETVLNIGQIKTNLEGQISDLEESIEEEMQNLPYARPDGIYPDMTVGAVIGADETAQWAQRESTGTGSATVRSVQGAAVAWNQYANLTNRTATSKGITYTAQDGKATFSAPNGAEGQETFYTDANNKFPFVAGHKYIAYGTSPDGNVRLVHANMGILPYNNVFTGSGTPNNQISFSVQSTFTGTYECYPMVFDLTAMFGEGNEPATVAEFESMYPASYYPYSAPTLKPVQIAGIRSTTAQGGELDSIEWTAQTLWGVGDTRDMLTSDAISHNFNSYTFTGSEPVSLTNWRPFEDTYAFALPLSVMPDRKPVGNTQMPTAMMADVQANTYSKLYGVSADPECGFSVSSSDPDNAYSFFIRVPTSIATNDTTLLTWLAGKTIVYAVAEPTTTPISPALPMTYKVQAGGSEAIIVPDGEVSAAPVLTVAEPVNAGDEFARIWEAIHSLGYTRNAAQLSRPVSLTDIGSIDEVQKDTTDVVEKEAADVAEIDTVKEVQE